MKAKIVQLTNKGMQQDLSISKTQNDYAFENINIRITADKDDTQLSVTSEQVPSPCIIYKEFPYEIYKPIEFSYSSSEQTFRLKEPINCNGVVQINYTRNFRHLSFTVEIQSGETEYYDESFPSYVEHIDSEIIYLDQESGGFSENIVLHYDESLKPVETERAKDPEIDSGILAGTLMGINESTEYVTLFTREASSSEVYYYIYRLRYEKQDSFDKIYIRRLYAGNDLNIPENKALDTLFYYESEDIQKVYWTDGVNEPRVINILNKQDYTNVNELSFYPNVESIPEIAVEKDYSYSGIFASGTIQYFVSYYNKFGAETSIVASTDLNYLSFADRGAKPDENVFCGMKITISNINTSFNYLRIYSAQRTSQDGPISARIVADIILNENSTEITYIDMGTGETIDSDLLLYVGGQKLIAETLACKDDTLFLGNITLPDNKIESLTKLFAKSYEDEYISELDATIKQSKIVSFGEKQIVAPKIEGYYSHEQQINDSQKTFSTFKAGEVYRFALQFMLEDGEWSQAYWVGDRYCDVKPRYEEGYFVVADAKVDFKTFIDGILDSYLQQLINILYNKYKAYRLLYASVDYSSRQILAQGIVSGTLFNYDERYNNEPYSIPSWNFRLRNSEMAYRHYQSIGCQWRSYGELQGMDKEIIPAIGKEIGEIYEHFKYFTVLLGLDPGHEAIATLVYFSLPTNANAKETIGRLLDSNDSLKLLKYDRDTVTDADLEQNAYYVASTTDNINTGNWQKTMDRLYDGLKDAHTRLYQRIYGGLASDVPEFCVPKDSLPTKKDCKKITSTKQKTSLINSILMGLVAAAAVAASVVTYGAAAPGAAALSAAAIAALAASSVCLGVGILGASLSVKYAVQQARDDMDPADKLMANKGWLYTGKASDIIEMFENKYNNSDAIVANIRNAFSGGSYWVTGGHPSAIGESYEEYNSSEKTNQFYVDNSIVTFNSPELDNVGDIIKNNDSLDFRIVGYVPIDANYMDYSLRVGNGFNRAARTIDNFKDSLELRNVVSRPFVNGDLYSDGLLVDGGGDEDVTTELPSYTTYRVFLWQNGFASFSGDHTKKTISPVTNTSEFGIIQKKVFANQLYGYETHYLKDAWKPRYGIYTPSLYTGDGNTLTLDKEDNAEFDLYNGRYNAAITTPDKYKYPFVVPELLDESNNNWYPQGCVYAEEYMRNSNPVRITFDSLPHAILRLKEYNNTQPILPVIGDEEKTRVEELYFGNAYTDLAYNPGYQYTIPWKHKTETYSNVYENTYVFLKDGGDILSIPLRDDYNSSAFPVLGNNDGVSDAVYANIHLSYYQAMCANIEAAINAYVRAQYSDYDYSTGADIVDGLANNFEDVNFVIQVEVPTAEFIGPSSERSDNFNNWVAAEKPTIPILAILNINYTPFILHEQRQILTMDVDFYHTADFNAIVGNPVRVIKFSQELVNEYFPGPPTLQKTQANAFTFNIAICTTGAHPIPNIPSYHPGVKYARHIVFTDNAGVYYDDASFGEIISEDTIELDEEEATPQSYLYIGEIYKKVFDYSTLYGGYSDYALQKLVWNVASDTKLLNRGQEEVIENTYGDTFFQRWDCLKSVPMTENDTNNIVEICSVMLESHINLDGRCDINRGISNILSARKDTWNLFNSVYNQEDNLFQASILDEKFALNKFKNQIVWSTVKLPSSNIDTWANINLLSNITVDGNYGGVNKLLRIGNNLTFFQDNAIGVVNYNNRTQVSTEQGLPLEVINSGKVNGYLYFDTNSGTINKSSIASTPFGVIYVDNLKQTLKLLNSEGSIDLGVSNNMYTWIRTRLNEIPEDVELSQYIDYDEILGDTYIHLNADSEVLVYNTRTKTFTTLFDTYDNLTVSLGLSNFEYGKYTDMRMFNVGGKSFAYELLKHSGDITTQGYVFKMRSGDYFYPYKLIYKVNPNPLTDKVFTNAEYIADFVDDTLSFEEGEPFKALLIDNEYQNGSMDIVAGPPIIAPANRKFRLRRVQLPRNADSNFVNMDRIRNPWCKITLQSNSLNESFSTQLLSHKTVFHSLGIKYFE